MIAYKSHLSKCNALKTKRESLRFGNCINSAPALVLAEYFQQHPQQTLVVLVDSNQAADQLCEELAFFGIDETQLLLFPDWEVLPYDAFSPHEEIVSERLRTLHHCQLHASIIIAPISSCLQRLLPKHYLNTRLLLLKNGDKLDTKLWAHQLQQSGYQRVSEVIKPGDYAIRGSLIDLYPTGSKNPIRIDLFDDIVDSLRTFDPDNQRSITTLDQINILPAHEFPLDEQAITQFRGRWRQQFSGNPNDCPTYQNVSNGKPIAGLEFYLPLFFESTSQIFDYIPTSSTVVMLPGLESHMDQLWQQIQHRYEQLRYDQMRPLLPPNELYLSKDEFYQLAKPFNQIKCYTDTLDAKGNVTNFAIKPLLDCRIQHASKSPHAALSALLEGYNGKVVFHTESEGRREVMLDMLRPIVPNIKVIQSWQQAIDSPDDHTLIISPLRDGFIVIDPNVMMITENDLLGEHVQRRKRSTLQQDPNTLIRNLNELHIGDPVVHITHGIGRYLGLKHLRAGAIENEFVELEYAGGDKIYLPIDRLDKLNRYISNSSDNTQLNRLGSNQWNKQKQKALKQIQDVAAKLLSIYSERASKPGYTFSTGDDYTRFRASFPFEETPDQQLAINQVCHDMTTATSMDRLVCGDVGFGKTEVAMQATFIASQNHKQVAVLVPTTLLANQHYQSFQNRFADWPVKIAHLTRFNTAKQQQEVLKGLHTGTIDIVIGTHKLLSEQIKFHDLGLLIIDEEHRFGVKHKEQIKALRANIDILTLTATPIPRTLNMAFHGVRDLSIIATPPQKRLSVKTFLRENSDALIKEAVSRELMRGGQVYFLHNDIATIQATKERLQAVLPSITVAIAHGKTPKNELERIMMDFYHQRIQILISTTIIESGIDVPTANTIIIERADKLGLAQLHQLRGRVGRSHHQAYAYLLVPSVRALASDAKKRLQAITACDQLGAGFNLASNDLEIRGAGEILGDQQSGHMQAIGFSLYMEMLNQAVEALKRGESITDFHTPKDIEIELRISALIPDSFVPDVQLRLTLYKQLADCTDKDEIQTFKATLIDRFGSLPEEVDHLLSVSSLKLMIKPMKITKLEYNGDYGYIHFDDKPNININKLLELIQTQSKTYHLLHGKTLRIKQSKQVTAQEKINVMKNVLEKLSPP